MAWLRRPSGASPRASAAAAVAVAALVAGCGDGSDGAPRARAGLFPGTGDLLVSMNQRDDLGARTPGDWLAQVREGEDWRFPACYGQGGADCRGAPTPLAVLDKHAAAGDVAVVTGVRNPLALATTAGGALLVGDWGTGTIYRIARA